MDPRMARQNRAAHMANGGNSPAPRPEARYPAPSRIRTWWSLYPLRLQGARVYPPHVIRLAAPVLSGPATPKTCSTALPLCTRMLVRGW